MIDRRQAEWLKGQIEWVFGLSGGELEEEPWGDWQHWYMGVPEYAGPEHTDPTVEYRTAILDCSYSQPPEKLDGWALDTIYHSSGETECPGGWMGDGLVNRNSAVCVPDNRGGKYRVCPYCEAREGTKHGMIYIGDGWVEAVYSRKVEDDNEQG
jgi:hypothetical protein